MAKDQKGEELPAISLSSGWDHLFVPPTPRSQRIAEGKALRKKYPREDHAKWQAAKHRPDPVDLLDSQSAARLPHLVPLRYGRMMQSPIAFFRGSAILMASDLSTLPKTDLMVQLCGDCNLSNFGIFATPERNVIFDLNDFDETLPGPFEWDLKRLVASFAIAADCGGFKTSVAERTVSSLIRVYRQKMEEFTEMSSLDIWYHRVDWEHLVQKIKKPIRKGTAISNLDKLKEKRGHAAALSKLTEVVDGMRRIKDQPPLVYHSAEVTQESTKMIFKLYADSLWPSRQRLLQRYHIIDVAMKVVGVGSVGTAAGIALLQGDGGDDDYIMLQIKQALPSVLEPYVGKSYFQHPGARVVNGQRMLQSASDMFLGWTTGPKRDFYIRQLMDAKASVPVDELDAVSLEQYAEVCGHVLARAHARTGNASQINGYIGRGDTFDEAMTKFALAYKKQNEADYNALLKAFKSGKIQAIRES